MRSVRVALVAVLACVSFTIGVPVSAGAAPPPDVGFLGSVSAHGPEAVPARLVLTPQQDKANLLVVMVAADGPGNPAIQQVVLTDDRQHTWTLRKRDVVFGSVIEVFTAPGTGHDAGTTVSSSLTVHRGDEGQAVTVAAYSNGFCYDETYINGSGGVPELYQRVGSGGDTYTIFVDGRHNRPIKLLPGEHPVNVYPAAGLDHDLYQVSHTDSHNFAGGIMHTGNSGPVASVHWGLLNVNIMPAQ